MRTVEKNKELCARYCKEAKEAFDLNRGRLFIVEQSKSLAMRELEYILKSEPSETFLCLVESELTANEFSELLSPVLGSIEVLVSMQDFRRLLKEADTESPSDKTAERFKRKHPRLIVAARDGQGKAVLNGLTGDNKGNGGAYKENENSGIYCVSDFLAACGYGFVAVDDVYDFIDISVTWQGGFASRGEQAPSSALYDRTELMNTCYYTDVEHSFKRLNNITAAAEACVLMSSVIFSNVITPFYMALKLLTDRFSINKARSRVRTLTSDYEESCADFCREISFMKDEDEILSLCLTKAYGSKQRIPSDIEKMRDYIGEGLNYMTDEEIFLRAVSAYSDAHKNKSFTDLDVILDALSESADEMAQCFNNIFFNDEVKGEIESNASSLFVGNMKEREAEGLSRLFYKHGIYHENTEKNACSLALLYRDDSGFEYFTRREEEEASREESDSGDFLRYSIFGKGDDWYYKILLLKRMITDGDNSFAIKTPLLVITDGDDETICAELKRFLPDYNILQGYKALVGLKSGEKTLVVSDYGKLRKTPFDVNNVGAAVFIDITPDIYLFGCVLNKITSACVPTAVAFATYGTLDGYMAMQWEKRFGIFDGGVIPAAFGGLTLSNGKKCDYADVIYKVNEVFVGLGETVNGQLNFDEAKEVANKINRLISAYTLKVSFADSEINADMDLLARLGRSFSDVYGEAVSVGGKGDYIESLGTLEKEKEKSVEAKQLFNVCVKALRRECDIRQNDCAGCTEYERLKKNDYSLFKDNIKRFFKEAKTLIARLEDEKKSKNVDATIRGVDMDNGENRVLSLPEIEAKEKLVEKCLKKTDKKRAEAEGMFFVPFQTAADILGSIADVYAKLLNKYYSVIMSVFYDVTEQTANNYQIVNGGFLSASKK